MSVPMVLDQTSLLFAIGFSGLALAITMMVAWLTARSDAFLLGWSVGMVVLVAGVGCFSLYGTYGVTAAPMLGLLAFDFLVAGFCIIYGSAVQFRSQTLPLARTAIVGGLGVGAVSLLFLLGWTGLSTSLANLVSAIVLGVTAWETWRGRSEAPAQVTAMAVLYAATALSFVPCGVLIVLDQGPVLRAVPFGWAEELNSIVCMVSITGIGALSLSLNQSRLARRHRTDALTDALTGLLNRRAVFDRHDAAPLPTRTAVIVFDLDAFKAVNDAHGHAIGDLVLQRFALAMTETVRAIDTAARLGGEEFVLIMPRATPDLAVLTAERIRALFETDSIETGQGPIACTVSAGVAYAGEEGESFGALLRTADNALYLAKRGGRNRVMSPGVKLVA